MIVFTQPDNGWNTSSLFCSILTKLSYFVMGWEHSQTLVVVAMCHYSACVPLSTVLNCLANIYPTLCLSYRHTSTIREDMGWIFAGHILRMFYRHCLQHMNNGSTIQDLGTNIWCMLQMWEILCCAFQHVKVFSLSKLSYVGYALNWWLVFMLKGCKKVA